MKNIGNKITLLSLFIIFFIYRTILAFVNENEAEIIFWLIILIIYSISLVVLYFILKKYQEKATQTKSV
jgi:hypothetical protein